MERARGRLLFAALAAALNGGAARAAEIATQLDYRAAASCPAAGDFQAVVIRRLGRDPFQSGAPVRVIVRIEPAGRALEGRLEWRDAAGSWIGEQAFPSRTGDCRELVRAMGFALAVQVQLMAAAAAAESREPTPTPTPAPAPAPPPPPPAAVAPPPPIDTDIVTPDASKAHIPAPGPSVAAGAGGSLGLGVASSAVAVGHAFAALRWPSIAVELGAEISTPSVLRRADGMGFSEWQLLGTLAGCGGRGPWSACLVGKAGEIRVAGDGVDVPATSVGLMVQAGVRLAAMHALSDRFQIRAHVDGLARLTQGVVTLDSAPVWTTPRFTFLVGGDVGVRFW